MLDFKKLFKQFSAKSEEGQGLVEYGMILFLAVIVVVAILVLLGPQIAGIFSKVTSGISKATSY